MLDIRNLNFSYKNKLIFNKIDLLLPNNGAYAICGENGSGKTTLLKIMAGIIKVDGYESKNTLYIDSFYSVLKNVSVYDNLKLVCDNDEEVLNASHNLGIDNILNYESDDLSFGEKIRLGVARAYLSKEKIIIIDEPTCNLDKDNRVLFYKLIDVIKKEKLVIISTNNVDDYEHFDCVHIKNKEICYLCDAAKADNDISFTSYNVEIIKKSIHDKHMLIRLITLSIMFFISTLIGILMFFPNYRVARNAYANLDGYYPVMDRIYVEYYKNYSPQIQFLDSKEYDAFYYPRILKIDNCDNSIVHNGEPLYFSYAILSDELNSGEVLISDELYDEFNNTGIITSKNNNNYLSINGTEYSVSYFNTIYQQNKELEPYSEEYKKYNEWYYRKIIMNKKDYLDLCLKDNDILVINNNLNDGEIIIPNGTVYAVTEEKIINGKKTKLSTIAYNNKRFYVNKYTIGNDKFEVNERCYVNLLLLLSSPEELINKINTKTELNNVVDYQKNGKYIVALESIDYIKYNDNNILNKTYFLIIYITLLIIMVAMGSIFIILHACHINYNKKFAKNTNKELKMQLYKMDFIEYYLKSIIVIIGSIIIGFVALAFML